MKEKDIQGQWWLGKNKVEWEEVAEAITYSETEHAHYSPALYRTCAPGLKGIDARKNDEGWWVVETWVLSSGVRSNSIRKFQSNGGCVMFLRALVNENHEHLRYHFNIGEEE